MIAHANPVLVVANVISAVFQDTGELLDADMRLVVEQRYPGDAVKGWVPAYRFAITVAGERVGSIELRLGDTAFIVRFGGHVAYEVAPEHRGHRFAARAIRLLLPLARRHGFERLVLTVDPRNHASRRSCEIAGAVLVDVVDLPEDCDMYREGDRQRCGYLLGCAPVEGRLEKS